MRVIFCFFFVTRHTLQSPKRWVDTPQVVFSSPNCSHVITAVLYTDRYVYIWYEIRCICVCACARHGHLAHSTCCDLGRHPAHPLSALILVRNNHVCACVIDTQHLGLGTSSSSPIVSADSSSSRDTYGPYNRVILLLIVLVIMISHYNSSVKSCMHYGHTTGCKNQMHLDAGWRKTNYCCKLLAVILLLYVPGTWQLVPNSALGSIIPVGEGNNHY